MIFIFTYCYKIEALSKLDPFLENVSPVSQRKASEEGKSQKMSKHSSLSFQQDTESDSEQPEVQHIFF